MCSGTEYSCTNLCQVTDTAKACPIFTKPAIGAILAIIVVLLLLFSILACFIYRKGIEKGRALERGTREEEQGQQQLIHFE